MRDLGLRVTQVLEEAAELSPGELDKLLPEITALRLRKRQLASPSTESRLLRKINCALPAAKRERYRQLLEKKSGDALTPNERREIIRLSDQLEWLGVARLRALVRLASLRGTSLSRLMKQLGIPRTAYAASA